VASGFLKTSSFKSFKAVGVRDEDDDAVGGGRGSHNEPLFVDINASQGH
jgi:hypothetical protein